MRHIYKIVMWRLIYKDVEITMSLAVIFSIIFLLLLTKKAHIGLDNAHIGFRLLNFSATQIEIALIFILFIQIQLHSQ